MTFSMTVPTTENARAKAKASAAEDRGWWMNYATTQELKRLGVKRRNWRWSGLDVVKTKKARLRAIGTDVTTEVIVQGLTPCPVTLEVNITSYGMFTHAEIHAVGWGHISSPSDMALYLALMQ